MSRASGTAESAAINAVAGDATYINLCTGDPGTTGANEASSTRQSIAWTTSSAGSAAQNSATINVSLAASTTVGYFGTWNASTSGTYIIGGALSSSITTGSTAGTVTFAADAISLTCT